MLGLYVTVAVAKFGTELTLLGVLWCVGLNLLLVVAAFVAFFGMSEKTYWKVFNFVGRRIVGPIFLLGGLSLMLFSLKETLTYGDQGGDSASDWIGVVLCAFLTLLGGLMSVASPHVPKDQKSFQTDASSIVRDRDAT